MHDSRFYVESRWQKGGFFLGGAPHLRGPQDSLCPPPPPISTPRSQEPPAPLPPPLSPRPPPPPPPPPHLIPPREQHLCIFGGRSGHRPEPATVSRILRRLGLSSARPRPRSPGDSLRTSRSRRPAPSRHQAPGPFTEVVSSARRGKHSGWEYLPVPLTSFPLLSRSLVTSPPPRPFLPRPFSPPPPPPPPPPPLTSGAPTALRLGDWVREGGVRKCA